MTIMYCCQAVIGSDNDSNYKYIVEATNIIVFCDRCFQIELRTSWRRCVNMVRHTTLEEAQLFITKRAL